MVCNKCGSPITPGATFCTNCGAPVEAQAPQAYNATPVYNAPQPEVPAAVPGKGLAVTSMVCGIVSFFCFGIILGILAIIFGGVAKSKGCKSGMATAGIVMGVVGIALYFITLFACGGLGAMVELAEFM